MAFVSIWEKVAMEKGRVQTMREVIIDDLAARFGSKPARVKKKLESITTVARLKSLHRSAIAAESLAELEARLP